MLPTSPHSPLSGWLKISLSLFLLWHAIAVLLGPMPPSYLISQVYPFFQPYMQALHLDNPWGFFAPDPSAGRFLRYRVIDAQGQTHNFPFTEIVARSDPAYLRMTTLSTAATDDDAVLASIAQRLCQQHAALQPARIELVRMQLARLTPEEFERGERVLDEARLSAETLPAQDCKPAVQTRNQTPPR